MSSASSARLPPPHNSPTLSIQGRLRQMHAFFRQRSPAQILAITAHNFREAA
jgi:hypothetical protein